MRGDGDGDVRRVPDTGDNVERTGPDLLGRDGGRDGIGDIGPV